MSFFETKLRKAGRQFRIEDKPVGRLSIAYNADEGVVVPIQAYLLEGAVRLGDAWRTIEKHGYHLCLFYDFLRLRNVYVFNADESHLRDFLLGGGTRYGKVRGIHGKLPIALTDTNHEKMQCIMAFYDFWERTRGVKVRVYRGATLGTLNEELFARRFRSISKAQINFSRAEAEKPRKAPHTPTSQEAETIIDATLDNEDQNRGFTWYFVASLARRSGLRASGISSLTLTSIANGMSVEGVIMATPDHRRVLKSLDNPENVEKLVQSLQIMQEQRRKFIFCDVFNKGGGFVPAAIPIDLLVELLDYICTKRRDLVLARFKNIPVPDNIFLSYHPQVAGGFLTEEAMSNAVNQVIHDLEMAGSLHRLRATFCEEVIRDLYIRERAINGRAWQIDNVLELARKLLGHKNPLSLETYMARILQQELLLAGEPLIVADIHDAAMMRGLCVALESEIQDSVRVAFKQFLSLHGIEPLDEPDRRYAVI